MRIYFSGISGTGIGPLAEFAQDAGFEVFGSDLQRGAISDELGSRQIDVFYGNQDGSFLQKKYAEGGIDWLVYTSALPKNHPELSLAKELGIKCSKRDEFLAEVIRQKNLKMIAVAGTHGKTTTTSIIIWAMLQLGVPISYLVGSTLGWAKSGIYDVNSEYFIYEADEYDKNFLAYHPYIAALTVVDYDHPDIYPTQEDYNAAFAQFESQSEYVVKNTTLDERINLVGELRRKDANIALEVLRRVTDFDDEKIIEAINRFPGVGRRFEKIANGAYSDYGHHPEEIKATVNMARELKQRDGYNGIAVVYQPHQNTRQHEIRHLYKDAFLGIDRLYWLPTYLTRENPDLDILPPAELINELENPSIAEAAELNDELAIKIKDLLEQKYLVVLITAGPADTWFRNILQ
ncbi:MAG: Mur ligase domain-containing protein [Candidatus Saccharibacteria bacterium]|nr:Mur ligase domain-containing protein [Candidatus Saccharibacteria bacterium]